MFSSFQLSISFSQYYKLKQAENLKFPRKKKKRTARSLDGPSTWFLSHPLKKFCFFFLQQQDFVIDLVHVSCHKLIKDKFITK